MDTAKEPKKASKQACDNCRRRKIKCSRDFPCDKCQRLMLSCSYGDILRRKGPKFRTLYPLAPSHPLVSRGEQQPQEPQQPQLQYTTPNTAHDGFNTDYIQPDASSAASSFFQYQYPQLQLSSPPESSSTESDYSGNAGQVPRPYARRLTSPILLAHVNVYLKYLFPIMPVVRREELQRDSHHPNHLSLQRYAFLAALCAATHIQLKLDGGPGPVLDSGTTTDGHALMSGEELLAEAVRARNECDVVEEMNIESLLTSLFLFASYGNLDKQRQAWFYLCQTTSMAFELGLHRESTYAGLNVEEAEEKRRVFWLLFVTERGYALQQARPVMLRNSIHKPQVLCSDDPILAYGFINLINLFEKLTVNLYDWISAGGCGEHNDGKTFQVPPAASSIQSSLWNAPMASLQGVLEIQQVDILITKQWLQAMMWKLSMGHAHARAHVSRSRSSGDGGDALLPFHLPIIVGKAVMGVVGAASQGAVDAHGIGMEQKLYDLGTTVAKVTSSYTNTISKQTPEPTTLPNLHFAESTTNPRELLWGILTTLSRIRGSQSYLFPNLLEQCKPILGLDCSITIGNFLPALATTTPPTTASGRNIETGTGTATAPPASWTNSKSNSWGLVSTGTEQIPSNNVDNNVDNSDDDDDLEDSPIS